MSDSAGASPLPTFAIKYGEVFKVEDYRQLPAQTIISFLTKGAAHYFGNEVASKVSTAKAKAEEEGTALTPEQIVELKKGYLADAVKDALDGTIGTGRASGPRRSWRRSPSGSGATSGRPRTRS